MTSQGFRWWSRIALVCALLACAVVASAASSYYDILGVSRTADDKALKKAYRKLSKQYHPDKNDSEEAQVKFLEITRSYEVLSDKDKRQIYDRHGEAGLKQSESNGGGPGGGGDPFDVFRRAFGFGGGGAGGGSGQRRGQNMLAEIEVDLKAMYQGDSIKFSIARKAVCEQCDGSGARSDKDIVECPVCEGRGIRLVRHQLAPGIFQQVQMHCDRCQGRGRTIKHLCSTCRGHRIVDTQSDLVLHVDRGLPEGSEIVFEGEADEAPDVVPGDVVVRVRSKRELGGFMRKESNLYWKEVISVKEALLGFKHTVKGLDGHDIVLSRVGVTTQPGFVDVVPGEGMPIYHLSGHGDLFVEYQVVFPPTLSDQLRTDLERAFGKGGESHHVEL
ncbi:hypothetical protein JCM3766R1_002876 [Sporobolomyces carnicolor]